MKSTLVSVVAVLVALATAAPAPVQEARAFNVAITFHGADGAEYFQSFPADNSVHEIDNSLSVTSISSVGGGFCSFTGAQGSSTVVYGEADVPVNPPQVQIRGSCDNA